jgi:hypothetical protein
MCGRLIKHKECDAIGMCLLENRDHFVNLREELHMVPPWVATNSWINDAACILHHIPFFIADNEMSILFLNEIQYMDKLPVPLLLELLLTLLNPLRMLNQLHWE